MGSLRSILFLSVLASPWAGAVDLNGWTNAASQAIKAATLSDAEVVDLATRSCAAMDRENKIAAPTGKYSKYNKRLAAILKPLNMKTVNGRKLDAKVYMVSDVNAFAMDNGCIRVFAGLMDIMSDEEVRAVVGHEIGHVNLGHSKKSMQTAYNLQAARAAVGAVSSTAASFTDSELGDLGQKFIAAQFSQSQETDADDQSYDLLRKAKLSRKPLVTVFQKLATLEGPGHSMFSSHPSSPERAQHIQARIDKDG